MDKIQQVDLLEGLLKQYSPTGQEEPAVQYLVDQMRGMGFDASTDGIGNAIGARGKGSHEIVLLGHIDTVPGNIPVRQEGDLLYGRGSVDAKGPLACFTAAAAQVEPADGWKITVVGALAEEGDSKGAYYIRDRRQPEFCVIGEPSKWDMLTLAYKGTAWLEYSLRLPMEHTAAASEAACDGAFRFWSRFQEKKDSFNTEKERRFDQLSASLRAMDSHEDGFYGEARLRFNLRLPPTLSPSQAVEFIQPLSGEGTLKLIDGIDCYRAEKNNSLVRAFLSAIRSEGGKPGFLLKTGTSDMNLVGPAWNCPILAYGPGDSSLDHTPHEHIQIPEYLKAVQVLTRVLNLIQGTPQQNPPA